MKWLTITDAIQFIYHLPTETLSDFDDVEQFADDIKRNSIRLKEIGTKGVPGWMYMALVLSMTPSV